MALSLQEALSSLEDPRIERHKRHQLLDIIILTICAVISGAEGWEAIEAFGKEKQGWLRKWIALENGIPSHDCIARVVSRIEPGKLTGCFMAWAQSVAIDGKTARHSYDRKDKLGAIHMVSAWANQAGISLYPQGIKARSRPKRSPTKSPRYPPCWTCLKSRAASSPLTRWAARLTRGKNH